jgi:hypothetical protein
MSRSLHILLAAAIFVCYSGLCGQAAAWDNPESTGMEMAGCHEMGHNGEKAVDGAHGQKLNNQVEADSSCCCQDSLVNAASQLPKLDRIVVAEIDFTYLHQRPSHSGMMETLSPREHDPPDIQTVNSIFLL